MGGRRNIDIGIPSFGNIFFALVILTMAGMAPAIALATIVPVALFFAILSLPVLLHVSLEFIIEKVKLVPEYLELKKLKLSLESKRANAHLSNTSSTFFRQSDAPSENCDSQLSYGK